MKLEMLDKMQFKTPSQLEIAIKKLFNIPL